MYVNYYKKKTRNNLQEGRHAGLDLQKRSLLEMQIISQGKSETQYTSRAANVRFTLVSRTSRSCLAHRDLR